MQGQGSPPVLVPSIVVSVFSCLRTLQGVKLFACLFFGSTPSSSQRHRLLPWSRMKAVDHGHLVSSVEGQEPVLCLAFSLPLWS